MQKVKCLYLKCKIMRVEREVGGGIGMGKTCKPKAVSFQCMTKFTTNKKKNVKLYSDIIITFKWNPQGKC